MEEYNERGKGICLGEVDRNDAALWSLGNSNYLEKRKPTRPSVCPWNCQRERKVWAETFQRGTQL